MNREDLSLMNDDFLKCKNCIFDDGCEKMFKECPANFIEDMYAENFKSFKYCNSEEFNKLTEDEQKEFVTIVVETNDKLKDVKSDIK